MEESEIKAILGKQEEKLDAIYSSVEKMRRYFLTSLIVTLVLFFLPLIGLVFVIPQFIATYTTSLDGL